MTRPGPRATQALLLTAAVGGFLAIGAIWLWHYRAGQPVDIDEAGYLGIAVQDTRALQDGGVGGLWDAFLAPSIQAPLMTLLTAPVFALVGPGILTGMLVPLALAGVMLVAAYGLGHEIGGTRTAWVTLGLTAGAPVVIGFSRSYNFAIASGAAAAVMLWALARSRQFERLGWSVAAGAAVGLVALSRTMTLAYLPSLVVVGLLVVAAGPQRLRRLGGLAAATAAALLVAGPWYDRNGEAVLDYLTSFGYGAGRRTYGDRESVLSLDSWRDTTSYVVSNSALPEALLWLLGAVVVIGAAVLVWRRDGFVRAALGALRSPLLPSLVWLGWGLAALTSSGNKGTGFVTPLVPAFALVTAWAVWRLPGNPARVLAGVVAAVCALNLTACTFTTTSLADTRSVTVPWVGGVPWVKGSGVIQGYVGYGRPDLPHGQMSDREARAWHHSVDRLTAEINEVGPGPVFTAFGFRHRLVNVNTVQLDQLLDGGPVIPLSQVDPATVPNDEQAMLGWLTTGPNATACLLLTSRGTMMEIEPVVDADLMSAAAKDAGFSRRATVDLPDHRQVVIWRRPTTCPLTGSTG